jgi:hypothetical protein
VVIEFTEFTAMRITISVVSLAALLAMPLTARAAPESFNPEEYATPKTCASGFEYASGGTCEIAAALKASEADCNKVDELEFSGGVCKVKSDKKKPDPTCKPLEGYKATIKNAKCQYTKSTPVSALSDYLGDCFRISVVPPGTGLESERNYLTTGQGPKSVDSQDRMLTLVEAERSFGSLRAGICSPKNKGKQFTGVPSSALALAGAYRTGWAYGALTMPYKYYPGEKSFVSGAPLGLYAGVRFGETGSAVTFAAAFTLGVVTGETGETKTDAQGVKTFTRSGSAQLPALSGAVGVIFDIFKSTEAKPFKIGLFVGQDRVNEDPTTFYKFNRKKWLAFQIGYDFTDN